MIKFPKHKCGLYLSHNQHKDLYETALHRIEYSNLDVDDFISKEDMQKCINTDELWELQWYPDTPIVFYRVAGSTLEIVLNRALEIENETT